ncbi:histidine kinase [Streptomyces sp. NPDC050617]|uniref:sensor histidine kinase n=1 Tax=Streptomyces sp. NPDC050617 TaxID=3154628 RepID=UPI003414991C
MFGRGARRVRWRERSKVSKVDCYTRWTLYGFPWFFFALGAPALLADSEQPVLAGALIALCLVHCVFGVGLTRRALACYLGQGEAPWRRLAVHAVPLLGSLAILVALVAHGEPKHPSGGGWVPIASLLPVAGAVCLMVRLRTYVLGCAVAAVLAALAFLPAGVGRAGLMAVALVTFVVGLWVASVVRCSGWHLSVVWETEAARETQARLAVAEERLRFGRDMHDVMGRNLAVIALKSELAVQLARRGSPAALDEMTEVQRIARESQREVRDVVRGYREADLHTELAGARSVLAAAGIDCRVDMDAVGTAAGARTTAQYGTGAGGGGALPEAVQSALGWVVREGTTNVLRHAEALHCAVRVSVTAGSGAGADGGVAVLVMDNDGVVAGAASGGGGSGLNGLRERLADLDGTVVAEHRAGGSFRLTARVPLGAGAAGDGDGWESGGDGGRVGGGEAALPYAPVESAGRRPALRGAARRLPRLRLGGRNSLRGGAAEGAP